MSTLTATLKNKDFEVFQEIVETLGLRTHLDNEGVFHVDVETEEESVLLRDAINLRFQGRRGRG